MLDERDDFYSPNDVEKIIGLIFLVFVTIGLGLAVWFWIF